MTLCSIAFPRKSLSNVDWHYSNIEQEALGKLHDLKKFKHFCFVKEVYAITDYKPSVAKVSKYVATLFQQLQCFMMCIHQYSVHILYKPGPELYQSGLVILKQP